MGCLYQGRKLSDRVLCVLGLPMLPLFLWFFLSDFGTVPALWYFFFLFILLQLRWYHTLQVKFDLLVYFFYFFLAVCLNISTVINIKILTNSNQQTRSYKFTRHIAAFLSVVLITEMFEICIQTSYDQNAQLILKVSP